MMGTVRFFCGLFLFFLLCLPERVEAVPARMQPPPEQAEEVHGEEEPSPFYSSREIAEASERFFGKMTTSLGRALEECFANLGRPNGYILGEEKGFALFGGLRLGKGFLRTKNAGDHPVFWTGPSFGWDVGVTNMKVMILIYKLQSVEQIYQRYPGVEGTASLIGGVSSMIMARDDVLVVPIRLGIGIRLGASAGYLKFTRRAAHHPF